MTACTKCQQPDPQKLHVLGCEAPERVDLDAPVDSLHFDIDELTATGWERLGDGDYIGSITPRAMALAAVDLAAEYLDMPRDRAVRVTVGPVGGGDGYVLAYGDGTLVQLR